MYKVTWPEKDFLKCPGKMSEQAISKHIFCNTVNFGSESCHAEIIGNFLPFDYGKKTRQLWINLSKFCPQTFCFTLIDFLLYKYHTGFGH